MKLLYKFLIVMFFCTACSEDFLEKYPLGNPTDASFLKSGEEMKVALNAAYRGLYDNWSTGALSSWNSFDCGTDICITRPRGTYIYEWTFSGHDSQTSRIDRFWTQLYKNIERCNYVIEFMSRGKESVNEEFYNQIMAQALFLRSFYYFYLCELWGDVPWIDKVMIDYQEAYEIPRTPKATIVNNIIEDLDFSIDNLPVLWSGADYGRINKAAAGALKARIALFNEKYNEAASAAQSVMGLGIDLFPNYKELFLFSGIQSPENLFNIQYLADFVTHSYPQNLAGRNTAGYSIVQPTRYLVDSYECVDGLSIDVSPIYNPDDPYSNRDPRLNATVLTSGHWFGGVLFHAYTKTTLKVVNGVQTVIPNIDWSLTTSRTQTPYLCIKNYDETDYLNNLNARSFMPVVVIRYAEVLLTYAEAMVELNQFDQTVCDATINAIRARVSMPPIDVSGMSQVQKRAIVRQERKVELAMEGLRYFDIRRWKIIEHVMNNDYVIGRYTASYVTKIQENQPTNFPKPTFDEWGISHYPDERVLFESATKWLFTKTKDYLWPIPQTLINVAPLIEQNPGY